MKEVPKLTKKLAGKSLPIEVSFYLPPLLLGPKLIDIETRLEKDEKV